MGDTINIDWARAQNSPDAATSYANAFQAGLGLARSAATQNAFRSAANDPDGGSWARSLTPEQRAGLSQRAEMVGALGEGLASLPYEARAGALAHIAPALVARGLPPNVLAQFDPTDEALDRVAAATRALQVWLGQTQS